MIKAEVIKPESRLFRRAAFFSAIAAFAIVSAGGTASAKHKKKSEPEAAADAGTTAAAAPDAGTPEAPTAAAPVQQGESADEMEAQEERSRNAGLGRAKIQHINDTGSAFRLVTLYYEMNGHPIYPVGKTTNSDFSKPVDIWTGVLPIGTIDLTVTAVYAGVGGVFTSYLNDMTFRKTETTQFKIVEGQETTVKIRGYEDNSPFTQTQDRPKFEFKTDFAPLKTSAAK